MNYWSTFTTTFNRKLSPDVRSHLRNVYEVVGFSLMVTALGTYLQTFIGSLSGGLIPSLLTLGFLIALISTPDNGKNRAKRLALLATVAFCSGLSLGPLINHVILINHTLLATAFFTTSVIFACFSLGTMFTEHQRWLHLFGTLSSILSCLIILAFINIFLNALVVYWIELYLGLFVMCGFIIFDTALIIEKRLMGDTDYIDHAMFLFMDFLNLFKHILVILLQKDSNKKKKK